MAIKPILIQVWLAGESRSHAAESGFIFDSFESADEYATDNAYTVYTTNALIDTEQLIEADDSDEEENLEIDLARPDGF